MSKPEQQETLPNVFNDDTTVPEEPARKRAAKKTAAKKTAAKKAAAKKTAVKKTAAKKTAKKAAKKTAKSAPAETPAAESEAPVSRQEAPALESSPPPAPVEQAPREESRPSEDAESVPKRFGRVPGGGPVAQRESREEEGKSAPSNEAPSGQDNRQPRESRSKRRREKRKKRIQERMSGQQRGDRDHGNHEPRQPRLPNQSQQPHPAHPPQLSGEKTACDGMLELAPKGFGFLRVPEKGYEQARDDVFVTPETIRKFHLRVGQWIHGFYQTGPRGPQLVEVSTVNDQPPEEAAKLPHFDELKAVNPDKRLSFETTPERFTTRVLDIMAPVGRGQRGLIVSPPRSGKTTLLLHIAEAIREKYEDTVHLMVLLVDERPEEVTEFRRALPGAEIYASSNDEHPRNHCRIAEFAIERAKRLVEAGKDVFLLMDSITRLARAYNSGMGHRGRAIGSGGITIGALEVPRRLFAAARNTREAGSLTILATALIQTNSRADEAIFMEFKGTGNMELVLDRKIAENYIYPAVDIFKSGTRREELLLPGHMLHKIHLIRRGLSGHRPVEAMERLIFFLKKFPNNPQMLLEIKG
jgi:transcription termination factor Rho